MSYRRSKSMLGVALAWIAAAAAFLFASIDAPNVSADGIAFWAFDVGQGDSCLFRFADGSTMLVDCGTPRSGKSLVKKLRRLGVERIDILVATHPHSDHIGGITRVIDAFEIGKVWDSGYEHGSPQQISMLKAIKQKGIRFGRPKAGHREEIGGAAVEVLAPAKVLSNTHSDPNNNSIILRVTYGDMSFLMMADAESEERATIKTFPKSVVLKLAHHGSSNGTDKKLMKQVSPEVAILCYGEGNGYGHPHREVRKLLADDGKVETYHTPNGDIEIRSDGATYAIEQRTISRAPNVELELAA